MAKNNPRISRTGVTSGGRFALYSNSPEVNNLDPALVRIIKGNSLSALYLSSSNTNSDDLGDDDDYEIEKDLIVKDPPTPTGKKYGVPSIGDISIVSNTVVYDAAGLPSVTLIFKIKNSSGETLRGMNAKVELI